MDVAFVPLDDRSRAIIQRMQVVRARPRSLAEAPPALVLKPPNLPPPPPAAALARPRSAEQASHEAGPSPETAAPVEATSVSKESVEPQVPANPFCEVSDGALEYFVEWSLEQSISDRPEVSASFSSVSMARAPFAGPRIRQLVPASYLVLGLLLGGVVGWMARSSAAGRAPTLAAVTALPIATAATANRPSTTPTAAAGDAPEPTPKSDSAAASSPATASLAITTRPAGASVSVDGRSVGETPLAIKVPPGSHEVSLTRVRYAPVASTVMAPGSLDVTLKRPGGTLVVESTPSAAAVLIQGEKRGKTPLRIEVAAFKSYDVQVAFADGKVWRRKVYLKAPSTEVQAKSSDSFTGRARSNAASR
jgi:hypothetical protein